MREQRNRERVLDLFRGRRQQPGGARGGRLCPGAPGGVGLGAEHLEPAARGTDVADAPVRLDQVRCPPEDAGLVHSAPLDDRGDAFEVLDRGLRVSASELVEPERGFGHTIAAYEPVSVVAASAARVRRDCVGAEAEAGLDPRRDACSQEPTPGRPSGVSQTSVVAVRYASLQRPRRQSSSVRITSATASRKRRPVVRAAHHDVEQPLGPVPVLQREVGEEHQAEDVLRVREVALDERFRELGAVARAVPARSGPPRAGRLRRARGRRPPR